MADNFQASKVAANELSSSTKFNNFVQAVEDAINSLDNTNLQAAAAIAVSKLAAGSNGDTLQTVAGVPSWVAGSGAPGYATTLPSSPINGQEAILVNSTTDPAYVWRFRYNANSISTYKWEFMGGAPFTVEVATEETCSSGTYGDLSTVGPSITIPNAGLWEISIGARLHPAQSGSDEMSGISYSLGATAASDDWAYMSATKTGSNVLGAGGTRTRQWLISSPTTLITAKYRRHTGSANFSIRSLSICPVKVS